MKQISPFYPHTQLTCHPGSDFEESVGVDGISVGDVVARENLHAFSVKLHSVLPLQSNSSDQYSLHRKIKISTSLYIKNLHAPSVKTHSCKIRSKAIFSWAIHTTKLCAELNNKFDTTIAPTPSVSSVGHDLCKSLSSRAFKMSDDAQCDSSYCSVPAPEVEFTSVSGRWKVSTVSSAMPTLSPEMIKSTHKGVN